MSPSRFYKLCIFSFIAGALTTALYLFDSYKTNSSIVSHNLLLARQIAAQAEGLAYFARHNQERDPFGWAVNHLLQGQEPRLIKLARIRASSNSKKESHNLDKKNQTFEYLKIVAPENHIALKIRIRTDYQGFIGTKTRAGSDAVFGLIFFTILALCWLSFSAKIDHALKAKLSMWMKKTNELTIKFGVHLRELMRETKNLAEAVTKSRNAVFKSDRTLNEVKASIDEKISATTEITQTMQKAEVFALNLIIDASRFGEQAKSFKIAAEQLYRLILNIKKLGLIECMSLKPLNADLERALKELESAKHNFEDVNQSALGISSKVAGTGALLQEQAKEVKPFARKYAR